MTIQDISEKLSGKFPGSVLETKDDVPQPFMRLESSRIRDVAAFLKQSRELKFDFLQCLTGLDRGEKFELVYHLYSYELNHQIVLKTDIDRNDPVADSVSDVYGIANWYEREAFDLLGIRFKNHPDLRRIMLPDDWKGHPLRKDYEYPKEYCGITHER